MGTRSRIVRRGGRVFRVLSPSADAAGHEEALESAEVFSQRCVKSAMSEMTSSDAWIVNCAVAEAPIA